MVKINISVHDLDKIKINYKLMKIDNFYKDGIFIYEPKKEDNFIISINAKYDTFVATITSNKLKGRVNPMMISLHLEGDETENEYMKYAKNIIMKEIINRVKIIGKRNDINYNILEYFLPIDHPKLSSLVFCLRLGNFYIFSRAYKTLEERYQEIEPLLEKNIYLRQNILSFFFINHKFNKLLKNNKLNWIIDVTPEFYCSGIKHTPNEIRTNFYNSPRYKILTEDAIKWVKSHGKSYIKLPIKSFRIWGNRIYKDLDYNFIINESLFVTVIIRGEKLNNAEEYFIKNYNNLKNVIKKMRNGTGYGSLKKKFFTNIVTYIDIIKNIDKNIAKEIMYNIVNIY